MNALVAVAQMPIGDIERVAHAIAKGGLFGSKDPNAVLTLCLLAHAEGQHPAVVFRDYHIINGKPAKKADAMLRDFINAGGKVEWHTLDDNTADATFIHPSGKARIEWTIARAKKAGISNPMWNKYPRQMLRSRVISEGVRTVYPGATSGLYEVGEVQDIEPETAPKVLEGQFQVGAVSPQEPIDYVPAEPIVEQPAKSKRGENWGGRYPTKMALKAALHEHQAALNELGLKKTMDDLDEYLTSEEYCDFIAQATEHAPYYLEGPQHKDAPPEFIQIFKLEQKARDMIAIRGNTAVYEEELTDGR